MPIFWLRMLASWPSLMRVMSMPSTRTCPPVGESSPAMMPRTVDLPEPEGPMRATNSPRAIRKLRSWRMSIRSLPSGRLRVIPRASSAAGAPPVPIVSVVCARAMPPPSFRPVSIARCLSGR